MAPSAFGIGWDLDFTLSEHYLPSLWRVVVLAALCSASLAGRCSGGSGLAEHCLARGAGEHK